MIGSLSRRVARLCISQQCRKISTTAPKRSDAPWYYRVPPKMPKKSDVMIAEVGSTFIWFWIFWHLMTDIEMVTGEFPWPDESKWTDEELGIPPDDEGL